MVLALPRGGVPVGFEVARALGAPFDVFLVRKLGVPWHPELAMGAIASGGVRVINQSIVEALHLRAEDVDQVAAAESAELARREALYRGGRPSVPVRGKVVVVVDDGLATGASMRAAIVALRKMDPQAIVVAVPVASPDVANTLRSEVYDVVCAATPQELHAVGLWYQDFSQTSDDEVRTLLDEASERKGPSRTSRALSDVDIRVFANSTPLDGTLSIPAQPTGIVLFAHGSGSSRFSTRNRAVAAFLGRAGFATLLVDLLTGAEGEHDDVTRQHRFDIEMLGHRVATLVDWLGLDRRTSDLPLGIFGASTGAAAALIAAAQRPSVRAVVSRGGRPDLAMSTLASVRAPTLLIVGSQDEAVLKANENACSMLTAPKVLEVVNGATHLFEEPGALERVAELAAQWFSRYLVPLRQTERSSRDSAESHHG